MLGIHSLKVGGVGILKTAHISDIRHDLWPSADFADRSL
jgi:hypothetical protein